MPQFAKNHSSTKMHFQPIDKCGHEKGGAGRRKRRRNVTVFLNLSVRGICAVKYPAR
jgi:hypothetical protein